MDYFYLFIELIWNTLFQCKESVVSLLYPCCTCSATRKIKHDLYPGRRCNFCSHLHNHIVLFCSDRAIPEFLKSAFIYYAKWWNANSILLYQTTCTVSTSTADAPSSFTTFVILSDILCQHFDVKLSENYCFPWTVQPIK